MAAYNPRGDLDYIGHVGTGTGWNTALLANLATVLAPLEQPTPPTTGRAVPRADARDAHWVRPVTVGEVVYRTWTPDGSLRHPSWRGLRPDKDPQEVNVDKL